MRKGSALSKIATHTTHYRTDATKFGSFDRVLSEDHVRVSPKALASSMVFYFECSDPQYTIYMGRDKHENEHLIANGWPEDLWFHVDNHSSAHVYLRLPKGQTWDDVPEAIVAECSQLTKANSIEGSKLSHVRIVYTPWANLRKGEGMADGQVGYHKESMRRYHLVEHRINAVINRLNKTKVERHNDPNELVRLRRERDAIEESEERAAREGAKKSQKEAEKDARKKAAADAERLRMFDYDDTRTATVYGLEDVDKGRAAAMHAETERAIKASMTKKKKGIVDKRGAGVDDASLVDDLFGGCSVSAKSSSSGGGTGDATDDIMVTIADRTGDLAAWVHARCHPTIPPSTPSHGLWLALC